MREYFVVCDMQFKGEKNALDYLRRNEAQIYDLIEQLYATTNLSKQLDLAKRISIVALAPVGGAWREDEVLVFGHQARGTGVFASLFDRGG